MEIVGIRWEIFVAELDVTVDYYKRLGFSVQKSQDDYRYLVNGACKVGVVLNADLPDSHPLKRSESEPPTGVELVIEVDDIDSTFAQIVNDGIEIAEPIQDREWGLCDFRLIDPDGYYLRITNRRN